MVINTWFPGMGRYVTCIYADECLYTEVLQLPRNWYLSIWEGWSEASWKTVWCNYTSWVYWLHSHEVQSRLLTLLCPFLPPAENVFMSRTDIYVLETEITPCRFWRFLLMAKSHIHTVRCLKIYYFQKNRHNKKICPGRRAHIWQTYQII